MAPRRVVEALDEVKDLHAGLSVRAEPMPVEQVEQSDAPLIKITNRDRVIFPEAKATKGDLADYYQAIAPLIHGLTARGKLLTYPLDADKYRGEVYSDRGAGANVTRVEAAAVFGYGGGIRLDLRIDADVDRRVAKHPRGKHRDRDEARVAFRAQDGVR